MILLRYKGGEMSRGKRTLIAAIIMLLLFIIVGGLLYYFYIYKPAKTPQVDPFGNWQGYQNIHYDYKLRYPDSWYLHTTGYQPGPPTGIMFSSAKEGEQNPNAVKINIGVLAKTVTGNLLEIEEVQNLIKGQFEKKEVIVSDQKGLQLTKNDPKGQLQSIIFLPHFNRLYQITLISSSLLAADSQATFTKI